MDLDVVSVAFPIDMQIWRLTILFLLPKEGKAPMTIYKLYVINAMLKKVIALINNISQVIYCQNLF